MKFKMGLSIPEIGDLSLLVKSDSSFPVATQPKRLLSPSREHDTASDRDDTKSPTLARAANTGNQPVDNAALAWLFRTVLGQRRSLKRRHQRVCRVATGRNRLSTFRVVERTRARVDHTVRFRARASRSRSRLSSGLGSELRERQDQPMR